MLSTDIHRFARILVAKLKSNELYITLEDPVDTLENLKRYLSKNSHFIDKSFYRGFQNYSFYEHNNLNFVYKISLKKEIPKDPIENIKPSDFDWSLYSGYYLFNNEAIFKISEIVSMEFVESKFQYDPNESYDIIEDRLPEHAFEWLKKYMSSSGKSNPPAEITKILNRWKSNKKIILFRGLGWYLEELNQVKNLSSYPFKKGEIIKYRSKKPSSWSTNKFVAKSFTKTGPYWLLLKYVAKPEDILVDTRLIHTDQRRQLYFADQFEVVLKKGSYSADILSLGYEKKELETGWEGQDPEIWETFHNEMEILAKKFTSITGVKWKSGTERKHYNGVPGIKVGNEKLGIVIYVVYFNDAFKLSISYWYNDGAAYNDQKDYPSFENLLQDLKTLNFIGFLKDSIKTKKRKWEYSPFLYGLKILE